MVKNYDHDIASLTAAAHFLETVIKHRLERFFAEKKETSEFHLPDLLPDKELRFSRFPMLSSLSAQEYLVLSLGLVPHLKPNFFEQLLLEFLPQSGDFPQLGGARGKNFRGFLPTGETALFLLGGDNLAKRLEVQKLFGEEHFFAKKHVLWLEEVPEGEPAMSGKIVLSQEYLDLLTTGKASKPRFSMNFPAQLLETEMEWNDLVLNDDTLLQIRELEAWINHHPTLMTDWGMRKKFKPGYRTLFHGPPGTGKTLTATLLGRYTGKDVYKIDLSMVVSKFIGETEKNLASLFARAENKDWILFFDEADALFSKRTNVRDAHDKYANQEVSYLLQRVENYDGLVILATNFKSNLDDAFIRRFQAVVHFPMPRANERLLIWQKAFPDKISLHQQLSLASIAHKYELSGAEIMNVVQFCCLQALDRQATVIEEGDLVNGIRREFQKEGKIMR